MSNVDTSISNEQLAHIRKMLGIDVSTQKLADIINNDPTWTDYTPDDRVETTFDLDEFLK